MSLNSNWKYDWRCTIFEGERKKEEKYVRIKFQLKHINRITHSVIVAFFIVSGTYTLFSFFYWGRIHSSYDVFTVFGFVIIGVVGSRT